MDLRKSLKIVGIIVVVLLLAWLVWYILNIKKPETVPVNNSPETVTETEKVPEKTFAEKVKDIEPKVTSDNVPIVIAAKRFAERLASYSLNRKDIDPVYELLPLVTPKAKLLAEGYYEELSKKEAPFYGVSSKVVSSKVVSVENDQAVIELNLLQAEQDMSGVQIKDYQSILTVELLNINNSWQVDNFIWK